MEELAEKLKGVFYLATEENGQPHVRPFDNAAVVQGNLYFGTGRSKKVTRQIINNPKIEVFCMDDMNMTRFRAEAKVEENEEIAKEAFEKMGKVFSEGESVALKIYNVEF